MESLNEKILTACRTELCGLYPGLNGAFALLPQKEGRILGTDGRTLFVPPDLTQMYAENPGKGSAGLSAYAAPLPVSAHPPAG